MAESKNMTDTPPLKTRLEKLGINQKFLETETGKAMAHALSMIHTQPDYALDHQAVQETHRRPSTREQ